MAPTAQVHNSSETNAKMWYFIYARPHMTFLSLVLCSVHSHPSRKTSVLPEMTITGNSSQTCLSRVPYLTLSDLLQLVNWGEPPEQSVISLRSIQAKQTNKSSSDFYNISFSWSLGPKTRGAITDSLVITTTGIQLPLCHQKVDYTWSVLKTLYNQKHVTEATLWDLPDY